MSGLVYVGKVLSIAPIPGADFIESLTVGLGPGGKWMGTARKGDFAMGDACEVYLQDSILPKEERFAFMERYNYRVRMARFKGVPSECLIMPLTRLDSQIGDDITVMSGVEKYEKPVPAAWRHGETYGTFPHFIPMTDEVNFQKVSHVREALNGQAYYVTQKIDGMSVTMYRYKDHFGVCSRRLEKKDTPNDPLWQLARKYSLDKTLPEGYAIQMEVAGPGIQKNPLGLKELTPFVFDVYLINEQRYEGFDTLCAWRHDLVIPLVEVLAVGEYYNFLTDDQLRTMAEETYPNGRQQEGIVIRSMKYQTYLRDRMSFKVINLLYKD